VGNGAGTAAMRMPVESSAVKRLFSAGRKKRKRQRD
jgi:hypothetical protein